MDFEKIEIVKIKMPTYLSEILGTEKNITFIYSNVSPNPEEEDIAELIKITKDVLNKSDLDVTGNPLTLDDFKPDDNLSLLVGSSSQPNNWAERENHFYPIDLSNARKVMNHLLLSGKFSDEKEVEDSAGLYIVCNGKDSKKTVLLGANPFLNYRFMTYIVNNDENEKLSLEYIKEKHFINCEYQDKVSYKVLATYNLLGYNLQHVKSENAPINSSVILKVTWNKLIYEPLADDICATKVILQLIAGHTGSKFYPLYYELLFLYNYLHIPSSEMDEDLEISPDPLHLSDIKESLISMLTKFAPRKTKVENKSTDLDVLNLKELREEDFLDKLWYLLKNCENLKEICICLTMIFEEFADNPGISLKVLDTNTSSIAIIIKGIGEGKLAVPTISLAQGLMFFIELGIHKLKNDYLHMIKSIDVVEHQKLLEQWDEFNNNDLGVDTRKTLSADKIFSSRRTRQTINKGSSLLNTAVLKKQLNFLGNMHIMVEFLCTLQKTNLSEDAKQDVSKEIFKKYGVLKTSDKLNCLKDNLFYEISVCLPNVNLDLLKQFQAASWNIQLESIKYKHSVKTVFYQSISPIIPTVVFNDYEVQVDSLKSSYFALESLIISNVVNTQ